MKKGLPSRRKSLVVLGRERGPCSLESRGHILRKTDICSGELAKHLSLRSLLCLQGRVLSTAHTHDLETCLTHTGSTTILEAKESSLLWLMDVIFANGKGWRRTNIGASTSMILLNPHHGTPCQTEP